jgi:pilus assembly protein CpaE
MADPVGGAVSQTARPLRYSHREMAESLDVLCLSTEPARWAEVKATLEGLPGFAVNLRVADPGEGVGDLRHVDLVIVMLGTDPSSGLRLIDHVHRSGAHVLALSHDQNPETLIKAIRAGADEYLAAPASAPELLRVCIKISTLRAYNKPDDAARGEVWVVYGPKGGVGSTTLVANLGVALCAAQRSTALLDLDVYSGDLACFLNLSTSYTLRDVITNFQRLDAMFLRSTMIAHGSGMHLLAAPTPRADQPLLEVSGEQTHAILELLDGMHDVTLVDTPGVPSASTRAALTCADRILLVTELNVSALGSCVRTLDWLRAEGVDVATTVDVVVNKHTGRSWEIPAAEAARRLGLPIRALLPRDDAAAWTAINNGLPLHDLRATTPLERAIVDLAQRNPSPADTQSKRTNFLRLFSSAESRP